MALYAALLVWLGVVVFAAWGVHALWSALIRPRVVNALLLPGTLVAQLGHVLGLLVTGNTVSGTQLVGDDEQGAPRSATPDALRPPILGPIVVGLLPLLACAAALYAAARLLGGGFLGALGSGGLELPQRLPTTLAGLWDLLRRLVTLQETLLNAVLASSLLHWQTALFLYLAVCATVRMAPFDGNRRGTLGAATVAVAVTGLVGSVVPGVRGLVEGGWPVLSFAVALLLFLLLVTLAVTGLVRLVRMLFTRG